MCSVFIVAREQNNERTLHSSSYSDTNKRTSLKIAMSSFLDSLLNCRLTRLGAVCADLRIHSRATAYRRVHGRSSSLNSDRVRDWISDEIILPGNFFRTTWSVMRSLIRFSSSSRFLQERKRTEVEDFQGNSTDLARFIHVQCESTFSRNKRRKHLLSYKQKVE